MIDFSLPTPIERQVQLLTMLGEQVMRPVARYYDEHEGERPWDYINMIWQTVRAQGGQTLAPPPTSEKSESNGEKRPRIANLMMIHTFEALSWGDAGLYLSTPSSALGGAAVAAAGTAEQKERFLKRFAEGEPKWGAMAMTEPQAGSDTAAIRTTARLSDDGKEWILNGEKIFVTSGERCDAVVVWATLDKSKGRAAIKSFVVEKGTPGMEVVRCEHKLGIRASDTATIRFEDCRVPAANLLGSPEIETDKGFAGVMQTFDNTRPLVAAMAVGLARAALQETHRILRQAGVAIDYDKPIHLMQAAAATYIALESEWEAAYLLTLRAAWMADNNQPNSLEASMAKAKAGRMCTDVTLRCVELCGSIGYGEAELLEKWARDSKILDIFEGTQQIQQLIVARRLLNKTSAELK